MNQYKVYCPDERYADSWPYLQYSVDDAPALHAHNAYAAAIRWSEEHDGADNWIDYPIMGLPLRVVCLDSGTVSDVRVVAELNPTFKVEHDGGTLDGNSSEISRR
jgi:hypothetical protein